MNRNHVPLILLIVLAATACAHAQEAPAPLSINGRLLEPEPAPIVVDGQLLVPTCVLESDLGVTVEQDNTVWRLRAYGRQLALRAGNREYQLEQQKLQAPVAPVLREGDLLVPVQILVEPLGLTVRQAATWEITTAPSGVTSLRQGIHPDRVRFVVDVSQPALFRWYEEPGKLIVEFPALPDAEGRKSLLRVHEFDDALAQQVTESLQEGFTRLIFSHASTEPPQLFTLSEPSRIVVDLLRQPTECPVPVPPKVAPKPRPGDLWSSHAFTGSKGPVRGYVIRFNPQKTGWTLCPALADGTIMHRRTVSRIAARHNNAYGAINGGFFAKNGPPLGMLVIDGEWIKPPLYSRAVLGITTAGNYTIANVDFDGKLEFDGFGFLPIESLNEGHLTDDGIVVFTQRWGPLVTGAPGKTRLAVTAGGLVAAVYPAGMDVPIPDGGYVISGNGRRAETLANICQGTSVKLHLQTAPQWPNLRHAIGGGPVLVVDGQVCVNGQAERFRSDVTASCRPRSAVGLSATGEVILLAVQNPGMTLKELAATMVKLGARSAMNLDGGGSTAIVVGGQLLNDPSDGCERAVSNAVLVVKE
ncbi:MAG: phosphodiester glycosidase family protein [Armatimonadia bacterium]